VNAAQHSIFERNVFRLPHTNLDVVDAVLFRPQHRKDKLEPGGNSQHVVLYSLLPSDAFRERRLQAEFFCLDSFARNQSVVFAEVRLLLELTVHAGRLADSEVDLLNDHLVRQVDSHTEEIVGLGHLDRVFSHGRDSFRLLLVGEEVFNRLNN
jgi:hypothetical protein